MRELQYSEIDDVSGGVAAIILVAALGFVWHEAGHIRDFVDGFLDGADR